MEWGLLHLLERPEGKTDKEMLDENMEMWEAAEDLGFDSIWMVEHHFSLYSSVGSSPVAMAAAISQRTKKLRIGLGIVVVPFHNPVRLAEDFATVDLLSDGRLDFGIGRGYAPAEFAGYDIPQEESRERMSEGMEVVKKAWTQDTFSHHGRFWDFEDTRVLPKPLQQPTPPIWGAAMRTPETFTEIGENGYNLLAGGVFGVGQEHVNMWREALKKAGHDPAEKKFNLLTQCYISDTTEQAQREWVGPASWFYNQFGDLTFGLREETRPAGYEHHSALHEATAASTPEALLADLQTRESPHAVGDVAKALDTFKQLEAGFGNTGFLLWKRLGGLDTAKCIKSMEYLSKEIMPQFE